MGRVSSRRLSADAFQRLRPWLVNISDERLQAAYLAIVEGQMQKDVAARYKWTQQAVSDAIATVWKRLESAIEAGFEVEPQQSLNALPEGWVSETLTAPAEMMERFKAEISAYQGEQKKTAARKTRSKATSS